ncbi:MAG: hypothetical protein D6794_05885 [Deltaproteobacteria bacterium]|nr:MAG: hypothetical protein D6794_05885 [Deltaproteobacteria bacterium]
MTAFGRDRVGIVADVTRILFETDCNLEETRMTQLADEFALILLFTGRRDGLEEILERETRRLEREKGISAFVRPLQQRKAPRQEDRPRAVVHVEGLDQAGIVYRISCLLAELGVNIVDLQSDVLLTPGSGSRLYRMDIHGELPDGITCEKLEERLLRIADELNVDISVIR